MNRMNSLSSASQLLNQSLADREKVGDAAPRDAKYQIAEGVSKSVAVPLMAELQDTKLGPGRSHEGSLPSPVNNRNSSRDGFADLFGAHVTPHGNMPSFSQDFDSVDERSDNDNDNDSEIAGERELRAPMREAVDSRMSWGSGTPEFLARTPESPDLVAARNGGRQVGEAQDEGAPPLREDAPSQLSWAPGSPDGARTPESPDGGPRYGGRPRSEAEDEGARPMRENAPSQQSWALGSPDGARTPESPAGGPRYGGRPRIEAEDEGAPPPRENAPSQQSWALGSPDGARTPESPDLVAARRDGPLVGAAELQDFGAPRHAGRAASPAASESQLAGDDAASDWGDGDASAWEEDDRVGVDAPVPLRTESGGERDNDDK